MENVGITYEFGINYYISSNKRDWRICGNWLSDGASMEIDNELGAYEDVLLTAEYVAEIYERNDMPEEA